MYKELPGKMKERFKADGTPDPFKWRAHLSLPIHGAEVKRREIIKEASKAASVSFTEEAIAAWSQLISEQVCQEPGAVNRVLKKDMVLLELKHAL